MNIPKNGAKRTVRPYCNCICLSAPTKAVALVAFALVPIALALVPIALALVQPTKAVALVPKFYDD